MDLRVKQLEVRMDRNRRKGRKHRILFLDFDGVVNVPYTFGTPEYEDAMARGVYDFFRPEIVERLNRLIHEYDLKVVISSSWRWQGIDFCRNSLYEAGFDQDVAVEGLTPTPEDYPPRHQEILDYLDGVRDVTAILILDDIPMRVLSDYAVETVFDDGYTAECDTTARAILDRQCSASAPHSRKVPPWVIPAVLAAIVAAVLLLRMFL